MASIRRRLDRGPGVWQVIVSVPKDPVTGKHRQLTRTIDAGPPTAKGEPPLAVRRLVGKLEAEVEAGRARGGATTVGFMLDAYIERCRRLGRADKTIRSYESLRTQICDDDGGHGGGLHKVAIGRLSVDDLDDFDGRMERAGRSITTRAHYFDLLSQALNMAVDREWIDRNPIKKMEDGRPRIKLGLVRPPSVAEVSALIDAALDRGDPDLAALVFVAAALGARRGELSGLTVGAVDWGRRQVVIRQTVSDIGGAKVRPGTKTGEVRAVSFDESTERVLAAQYARVVTRRRGIGLDEGADGPPGEVFLWSLAPDHGVPWRPDGMTHAFTRLRDRCELPHVHLHALRHLAVTRALEAGVDVKTASARFGHDPTLMLERYAHAIAASDQRAARASTRGLEAGGLHGDG